MTKVAEPNQSLWLVVIAPTIWAVHFMASYVTAAVWCAKFSSGEYARLGGVRGAIALYTAVALAGIVANGWFGYRRATFGRGDARHRDLPEDRHRFLGHATLLLAGLSAVATLYVAAVAMFFETCR